MIKNEEIRTLLIGETVKWFYKNVLCEGIVKDDLKDEVWILKTKHGDKSKIKKVKVKRTLIITKEQENMDIKKLVLKNKFKSNTKDQLLEMMETENLKAEEREVIVEILTEEKGVNIDDIPNYDAPDKKEVKIEEPDEEEIQTDTLNDTPPPAKEQVMYEEPLTEEEILLQEKQQNKKTSTFKKKMEVILVDPRELIIEDGFNARFDLGEIDELKDSIIENGIRTPLQGYKEDGKYYVVDGHRRTIATLKAISEGNDITRIPFIEEKKKNLEERIFDILLYNDGKQLTPLELGEAYRKLVSYNYNFSEIARKIGKTVKHVSDMVTVAESSKELKDLIEAGDVSATLVSEIKTKLKNSDLAEKIIKEKSIEKKEKAKETGKEIDKKVTKKDIRDIIEKQKDNSKNSAKHQDVDDIKQNKVDPAVKLYTEEKVKELLHKQIDACKAVLPDILKVKLDSVNLVL